jgi:two-component system nitrate/nitrite sensor histidine kinase NarX
VRHGLADARQSIWALRTQDAGEDTLPVKLRRLVDAAGVNGLISHFSLFGAYRPLPAEMERELLRVAQESIHNVKKHARASELWVHLEYGPEAITLEVRDNGRGGAMESALEPGQTQFGLVGMRERAATIGAILEVRSEAGEGTMVHLRVPVRGGAREQGRIKE